MPSVTDVMNRALARIGSKSITGPTEESSGARAAVSAWEFVRPEVIRSHSWNAASARATIVEDGTDPDFQFGKRYSQPGDCLRVLGIVNERTGEPTTEDWMVEGRFILTDLTTSIDVRYLRDLTDVNSWDPLMLSAGVARLAAELALDLRGSRELQKQMLESYEQILARARRVDGQEQSPQALSENDTWLTARV